MLQKATLQDCELLTHIALTSKAYWGYTTEQIEGWRKDLTVSTELIRDLNVVKFIANKEVAGFYALHNPKEERIELEMLFVLPKFIGKGIGKQLLSHALTKAKEQNAVAITLLADPNAVPFYKAQGFYEIDKKESTIPGRFLPVMQKDLT
ncbi:MAG: GNAT family N-acetyltransferase [Tenacibaculum sp.]